MLLNETVLNLRNEWERTSFELEKLSYNQDYIEQVGYINSVSCRNNGLDKH